MANKIKLFEQYHSSYNRVIPRDFFNEGKLMKCMGFLALSILDNKVPENISIEIEESGEPFQVELDQMFGLLYVENYRVMINGDYYLVGTTYNSKENFPFYVVYDDVEIEIFNDGGKFSDEFIETFSN